MSVYDFIENPDTWEKCPHIKPRDMKTPGRSFIHFWLPKTIKQYAYSRYEPTEGWIYLWVGKYGSHYVIEAFDPSTEC